METSPDSGNEQAERRASTGRSPEHITGGFISVPLTEWNLELPNYVRVTDPELPNWRSGPNGDVPIQTG